MPQSQVNEVDVVKESVRHNEKSIDALRDDFKEFRKEVNSKFERVDSKLETINTTINTKFEAINNKFIALYALIAFSILVPIAIAFYQDMH